MGRRSTLDDDNGEEGERTRPTRAVLVSVDLPSLPVWPQDHSHGIREFPALLLLAHPRDLGALRSIGLFRQDLCKPQHHSNLAM